MSLRIPDHKTGQQFEIEIDSLSYNGGRGVGRHAGVVVFVPLTVPGDRALVRVTETKGNFLVAEVENILRPAPSRRQGVCPVFGRCGGCSWQHVEYPEQLKQKQLILESALRPLRRHANFEISPLIPSPVEYGYRNRIQIQKQGPEVGFFARRSRQIVSISGCPIAEADISAQISKLTTAPDGRYEISRRRDGSVGTEAGKRDPETALFSQVNTRQNERLINTVLVWARECNFDKIWDLYCGSGNLTFPLAEAFSNCTVHGVELSRDAINLALNAESEIQWHAQDTARFLADQPDANGVLLVLDPPRVGLQDAVIQQIRRLRPSFMLYVSCNPMTFSRDAQKFIEAAYILTRVQGLDMFPQTEHVELIGLFQRP